MRGEEMGHRVPLKQRRRERQEEEGWRDGGSEGERKRERDLLRMSTKRECHPQSTTAGQGSTHRVMAWKVSLISRAVA